MNGKKIKVKGFRDKMVTRALKNEGPQKSMEGTEYAKTKQKIADENEFMKRWIHGKFFFERANMIAEQIEADNIEETVDGVKKSKGYMVAEYGLMKWRAKNELMAASFTREDLKETHKMTEKDIAEMEKDFYEGPVLRDKYDERFRKGKKA